MSDTPDTPPPVAEPSVPAPPRPTEADPVLSWFPAPWGTGLFLLWTGLAWLAHATGFAPLQSGTGWILGAGVILTAALFHHLLHLPATDQPSGTTTVAAQSLMGIVWATLYSHFAGGESLLTAGMYSSAVLLAVPAGDLRLLRYLVVVALTAEAALIGVPLAAGESGPGLAAVHLIALALVLGTIYVIGSWHAEWRSLFDERHRELKDTIGRVARRAERDHLTNSYNRRHIMDMLSREKARSDRTGDDFCICLLDIDHFKAMNDRYGHLAGDRILASFARRVRSALRGMDVVNANELPNAFGRIGGEEFIVINPHTSLGGALRCAERIRHAVVRRPFNGMHQVTVSIGIAEYRTGESISSLLGRADKALYEAKNAGRNRVHCATADGERSNVVMPEFPRAS